MTNTTDITQQGEAFLVSGEIRFDNVMSLYQKSLALLQAVPHWKIDLSGVTFASSAAVALLIEWKKCAVQHSKTIEFIAIPEKIASIAHAAKLDDLVR